jgi:hypothetical protein
MRAGAVTGEGTTHGRASLRDPLLVGLAGATAFGLLRFRDPHASGAYGFCPFQAITGLPCPGCGGLRSVNDLTRGDVGSAVGSNVLVVALVAVLAVAYVLWVVRRLRGRTDRMIVLSPRAAVVVVVVVAAFGVLRWTPWGAALAP